MTAQTKLETIVVATDFSENASKAIAWGRHLAREHRARLVLVHATTPATPPAPEFVVLPADYFQALYEHDRKQLDGIAAGLRSEGLAVDPIVEIGPAASGILDATARERADLLIVGTRGRTGFKRILLGSTAAQLVRRARCAVMTVHPNDAGPPRPIRTVLVPTDFSEDATRAAEEATRVLAGAASLRVVLVHAFCLPIETEHLPARRLVDVIRQAEQAAQVRIGQLATALRRPGLTIETLVREGHPADVVLEHAATVRPDLIAMGTHGSSGLKRLFLGSTTERVLPSAPCPVLTFRRADAD